MLNHVVMMGRLTKDPELRYTRSNTPVASFRIATDRDYTKGEKETDFFNCVAWRATGEFVNKYFFKGSMIVVSGRLANREWMDNNGIKHQDNEIVCDNVYFGESKRNSDNRTSGTFQDLDDDEYGDFPL